MISSLVSLECKQQQEPKVKRILESIEGRIATLANLYSMLFSSGELHHVPLDQYLRQIALAVKTSFISQLENITLQIDIPPINIDVKKAAPLGMIVNELMTNALKHAFVEKTDGTIRIAASLQEDQLQLSVADNGADKGQKIDLAASTGLGLQLVQALTMQLQGKLQLNQSRGTEFNLQIPLAETH